MSHRRGVKEKQWPSLCLRGKHVSIEEERSMIGTVTFAKRQKRSVTMLLGRIWEDKYFNNTLLPPNTFLHFLLTRSQRRKLVD